MRMLAPVLAAASILGLHACAPTSPSTDATGQRPERQCFDADRLRDFDAGRNQTVRVTAYDGGVFELQTSGACQDIDSSFGMALVPFTRGSERLCTGDWAQVVIQGQVSPAGPCRARVTRKLTEDEVAALPSRRP